MNIKVIRANSSHAETIASIGKLSFRDAFGNLFNDKVALFEYLEYTYSIDKVTKSINKENNIFFIALVDTVPVGFAKVKKYSLNEQIESIAQMELQKIYVLSYYHGSGAGAALMQAVLDLAHQVQPDYVWLDTHVTNVRAIRFYEKNGFIRSGKNYFTIGNQTFEYYIMCLPVAIEEEACCN
jgi:ribosomal protein S18 acetylase RimI-like enzyme